MPRPRSTSIHAARRRPRPRAAAAARPRRRGAPDPRRPPPRACPPGPWADRQLERVRGGPSRPAGARRARGARGRRWRTRSPRTCSARATSRARGSVADPGQLLRAERRWTVLVAGELVAVLDARLGASLCRYPEVNAAVVERLAEQMQRMAVAQAIGRLTGVDRRLLALFWHLAERWGRVAPHGVRCRSALAHGVLADLVGARRPTVSTALGQARPRGASWPRLPDGSWLLTGEPVGAPTARGGAGHPPSPAAPRAPARSSPSGRGADGAGAGVPPRRRPPRAAASVARRRRDDGRRERSAGAREASRTPLPDGPRSRQRSPTLRSTAWPAAPSRAGRRSSSGRSRPRRAGRCRARRRGGGRSPWRRPRRPR